MHNAYDYTTLLDKTVPLGEFLDEQLARVNVESDDISETDEIIETKEYETPIRPRNLFIKKFTKGHSSIKHRSSFIISIMHSRSGIINNMRHIGTNSRSSFRCH